MHGRGAISNIASVFFHQTRCWVLNFHPLRQPYEDEATVGVPILQTRKLRLREVESLAQGHTTNKWQGWDSSQWDARGGPWISPLLLVTSSHLKLPYVLLKRVVKMGFICTPEVGMTVGQYTFSWGRWEEGDQGRWVWSPVICSGNSSLDRQGEPECPGSVPGCSSVSSSDFLYAHFWTFSHRTWAKTVTQFVDFRILDLKGTSEFIGQTCFLYSWRSWDPAGRLTGPGGQTPCGNTYYYYLFL